jgi:serine/threonine-protein kinase
MAPEQATAAAAQDARVDIYALGALMYFALTGRPPFEGVSAYEVMMAHARDPVVPPSKHRPDVPADLEYVVLKCLEKKPADRYQDTKSLAVALAACGAAGEWGPEHAEMWWADVIRPEPNDSVV